MKYNNKRTICVLLLIIALLAAMAGCGGQSEDKQDTAATAAPPAGPGDENNENKEFTYSDGIDENGYWEGVKALDLVELFNYKGIIIPKENHEVPEDAIQEEIDSIMESYPFSKQVTDRAVEDGDTVNIDYVGSVGGKEFDGGNTNGAGTEVTIGVTNYIDDFLEQLIGHWPGETFNIEVTFPKDYGEKDLSGKDAVFVTTVNFIVEDANPELTDDFVSVNFSEMLGWKSVDDLIEGVGKDMKDSAIKSYIQSYMSKDVTVKSLPDFLVKYQENVMIDYYKGMAESYGVELEDIITSMGVSDVNGLLEQNREVNEQWARFSLVSQAIAEDLSLVVSDKDIKDHFLKAYNIDDYSQQQEFFGLPYLKQVVLHTKVLEYVKDHAVLA